jgi:hypothetical protein
MAIGKRFGYYIRGLGKDAAQANADFTEQKSAAERKLLAGEAGKLPAPITPEFSIDALVKNTHIPIVSEKGFNQAVAEAALAFRVYDILSYTRAETYQVTKKQLDVLLGSGVKGERKSPTAGPMMNGNGPRENIADYLTR